MKVTENLNNFAISSDGIATALQDSASSLMAANNSYEEAVAMIASANRVVQDPNSVGAALRTISLRLRGTSVKELEESGEDTTGAIESKSKLRSKIKGLSGVDILTDTGAYKSTYEILLDISKVWKDMSDIDQAALLEILAGKTRSNTAAAILSNTKDLEEAYKSAMNAEGSALEENEKYLDSIQGRIDLFTNSVQTMWNNVLDSDTVKTIVDIGTGLIKIVDQLGLVQTLVFAIGTYLIQKHFKGDLFGGLFGENISDMKSRLKALKDEYVKAEKEFGVDSKQANKKKKQYNKYNDAVSPYIDEHDKLSETLKSQRAEAENAQKALDSYNNTLKEKETLTAEDIAQQDALKAKVAAANTEVTKTEAELKKVEVQANAAGTAGLTAGQRLKTGFQAAWKSIKQFGTELIKSMAWSLAITAVLQSITNIGEWIGDAWNSLKPETFEDLQEALEQTESELSNVESEIRSLNSELDDTNGRIEELMSQDSLSYIEQEELDNLKSATAELKAQIALKETLQKSLQTNANGQAIVATDEYLDTSFMSDQTRTEKQEEWGEAGKEIGETIGTVGGLLFGAKAVGAIGAKIGTVIAPGIGTAIGVALGAALGGLIGTFAGEGLAGASYDSEQTVGEAMDNMIARRKELKKAQDDALAENDVEAYNEATEALTTYDNQMAKHISQIQENYNAMDWETATAEQKKQMIEYADWLSKYSISMGTDGAKTSAIERMFGTEASDDVKRLKKNIEEAMAAAKADGVEPDFDFQKAFDSEALEDFRKRLYRMGLTVSDVESYFLDLAKAEKEAEESYTTYDTVKQINSLSSSIKGLKDAFGEIIEEGYVSTETLVELGETFGHLGDSWENFVDTVAFSKGSIKEATEAINELVEAYLMEQLSKGKMSVEEKLNTIMLLHQLGVKNATEYVNAMQKANLVDDVTSAYLADQERIEELEAKKKENGGKGISSAEIDELEKLDAKTIQNYITEYEKLYGIDLSAEEEQLLIQKSITAEKAKQAALDAKSQKTAYDAAKKEYDEALKHNAELDAKINAIKENPAKIYDYGATSVYDSNTNSFKIKYGAGTYTDASTVATLMEKTFENQKVEVPNLPVEVTDVDVEDAEDFANEVSQEYQDALDSMGLKVDLGLTDFDIISDGIDKIQDAYSTLKDTVKEYNENGFLTLDNLQALLSLEPEYLACLQMENGQLSINQQAMQNMVQARLAEAKATVVQSAMDQLHTLAARTEEQAVNDSANAASNAVDNLGEYAGALGTVAQDAIVAAGSVSAFNAAVAGAQANEFVNQSEIDAILSSMNTQLEMIDSVGASLSTNFNSIMGTDGSDADGGSGDSALERIQSKYEGKISNLENQQTYIQNEIDRLEAEDEAVSKSYYDEQIAREEEKIGLYQQELEELKALYKANPTQETAEAIWEIEHALQDSTMAIIEFKQAITDLYVDAFDDIISAFDNSDDFLSDQQNYIDKYQELMELQGKTATAGGFQEQIAIEEKKMADNVTELNALRQTLADGMTYGYIEEGSEEWVDLQDKIRSAEEAVLDNQIAIEQYREELKQLSVDAFELVRNAFSSKDQYFTNQQDYIQGYADLLEAQGVDVPAELYDKLIEVEQQKRENNVANLIDARQGFADIEAAGYTAADEEWQDAYQQVVELEKAVQDNDIAMAEWAKTIRDLDFEKFDRFLSRLDDINSELENLRGLFDGDDVAFKDGTWTEEGITSLGLLYHQMELAQQKSQEYAQKIDELNGEYDKGEMSEQEYYERLQELKDGQWDAINAYESAKDAMVDMEEARIDMIEEGINEEIEAYQELIDLKKEELDAERDLYDFKKNIKNQSKDIASLERRIASLSGSTNAADVAERRRLQAELNDAREELNDTYYNHAKDQQNKALDDEMTSYQDAKDDYLETLRDTLEDTKTIINEKIQEVLTNADIVLNGINTAAGEHSITLSGALTQPWNDASTVALAFKTSLDENLPLLTNEDGVITSFSNTTKQLLNQAFGAGSAACKSFKTTVQADVAAIKTIVSNATSPLTAQLKLPWTTMTGDGSPITTFSTKVRDAINNALSDAKNKAKDMKTNLTSPWTTGVNSINTWSEGVESALKNAQSQAKTAAEAIKKSLDIKVPSYTGGSGGNGTGDKDGGNNNQPTSSYTRTAYLKTSLQTFREQGSGPTKEHAEMVAKQEVINAAHSFYRSKGYSDEKIFNLQKTWEKNISYYAKGTTGTTKDQWAITDEIGDELVLIPGKDGNLQYMRKGTSVIPADISKNLIEWGKITPNMEGLSSAIQGVNIMTNVINKPEVNLSFEALVKAEHITEETLPAVKKLVTQELDNFARKLNYSLKKFS